MKKFLATKDFGEYFTKGKIYERPNMEDINYGSKERWTWFTVNQSTLKDSKGRFICGWGDWSHLGLIEIKDDDKPYYPDWF